MIVTLTPKILEETLQKARTSPRKRAIYCFHQPDEVLQRMINAGLSDTYFQPHKHENPDKIELFSILYGKMAIFTFNDVGEIEQKVLLEESGKDRIVEIPPRTWHGVAVISPEAVVYEIIEGKYDSLTHKDFAPWAPAENSPEAPRYLEWLKSFSP